jgi:ABC-type multidrug transport system fused ATPase/permease subunit
LSKYYHVFSISPELLGLSIVYSLSIVNNLNGLIGSVTETEQEMISVERVLDYSNLKNEFKDDDYDDDDNKNKEPRSINIIDFNDNLVNDDLLKPLLNTQQENNNDNINEIPPSLSLSVEIGSIKIKSLSMKYNNGTLALRDLNINIDAGSRVAIVGRTGSG